MEGQKSIYYRKELDKNFFLPEETEKLYEKKKDLHFELDKIYEKIAGETPILEKDRLNIASCLFQNLPLREIILGDMSNYSTRKTLENLSKMNDISNYQLKKTKKEIKDAYIEQILKYKKENNTLNYTDLQKLKQINNQKDLEQEIVDTLKTNPKHTYAEIARKYNLKDGRVAKKIIEKNSINTSCDVRPKEDRISINNYEIVA